MYRTRLKIKSTFKIPSEPRSVKYNMQLKRPPTQRKKQMHAHTVSFATMTTTPPRNCLGKI